MKYKRTQKRSKQMWQRVEKFSIRKFSFGAASCLIGASLVGAAGTVQPVEAALTYEKTGDKTARTLYTNLGESPDKATGSGVHDEVDVNKEIQIDVDWSQYSKTNPYVKVTYKFNGGYGASALYHYGGGRPEFWFTTPIGVKEPRRVTLYNTGTGPQGRVMTSWKGSQGWISLSNSVGSRYQNEEAAKALNAGDPTKWEWYNDTTGESGKTYRGDLDAMFWWRMGDTIAGKPGDQAIYQLFKDNTKSFYADWERAAHQSITIEAEYEVVDPTLKNERYTLDFGAGVKVGHAGSLRSRFKVAAEQVPALYKNTEFFEPKIPDRLGVGNTTNLTQKEKDKLKEKIWEANQDNTSSSLPERQNKFVDNLKDGKEGIQIGNDGTATITYLDGSTDVIPGGALVYKDIDAAEPSDGTNGTYYYHISPYPVANLDNISDEEIEKALQKFYEVNGMTFNGDLISSVGNGVSDNFVGKFLSPYKKGGTTFQHVSILNGDRTSTGVSIPKGALFKLKATFNDADATEAKVKGNETIDKLTFLSPKEKEVFKKELKGKTSQEDINSVVNKAISRNSANEKGIAEKKLEVKKGIDALTYLTNAEKEELRKKVDDQGIADPENADGSEGKALDHTKSLLDKILTDATATNLAKAKEKAKEQIEKIKDSLTPEKVEEFKNKIESADSVSKIEEILKEAETLKAKTEAQKAKDEADKLKEEYKKKIDQIPGLSDEDKTNYKKQIDEATSKDQLDRILKDAEEKVSREQARTDAKAIIDGLTHLNNAQKTELKEQVAVAGNKEELDRIVNTARDLDSKMDSLQQLVAKANEVKVSDNYNSADQDKKTAFDKAKEAASKVADKATGTSADASEVSTLIENLAKAIKELTGQEVTVPVSKDALKAEIAKEAEVHKSPAYLKDNKAKQDEYDKALNEAKTVLKDTAAKQEDVDAALEKLQRARTALSGKAEDFTLGVTDGAAKISVEPKVGAELSEVDKGAVKAKVTANNEALKQDETVTYGNITEKDGKTYVKVTVTRDGVSKEIEVPVEGTEAAKSPLKDPEKVKVTDPKKLTPEEQTAVKEAVKKANDTLKDNQITVDEQGNVTVTYSDQSQNKLPASKTVEAKTEAEKALDKAKEKAKADLTEAANKEKAEIEADKTLTEDQKKAEKDKVDKVKEEQEKNIDKATTTDEVTTATEAGKKAIDAVHKTNAEQATPTVTGGAVEISVDPNTATNVDSEADKTAIKDAVTVPEGQPQPTKKEILNDGAIKDGKTPGTKVVEVEVTYEDGSKETIEVPVVKKDKAFTVGVKDPAKPIEIPNTPIVGEDLKDEDKEKVKENLLVNGESLKEGDKVEFGKVTKDQDKTVVPVTVTRDGKSETINVEVTKKSEPFKLTVTDSTQPVSISKEPVAGDKLTPEDETLVKNKVRVNGEELQANEDVTVGVIANEDGKFVVPVTVTRDGKSETIKVEVTKKSDTTSDQGNQEGSGSQGDQTGQGGIDSQGDQTGQGGTGSQGDQAGQGGTGSQNDQNGQGDSNSNSTNKTELEKAKAQAKSDLAQAAAKEKAEIDADDKLSEDEKAKSKAEVDKVKREQEAKIDEAKTTDEVKTAVENGKKAIDAVHQITPEQAKSDLDAAANAEKGEIGGDTTLTDKEKEDLKAKVDEVKKAAEDKINNAKTPEEIAKSTEEGKKAIADVYNPQTAKGQSTSVFKPELDLQTALVSGKVTVEKGKDLTDEEILKQLALAEGLIPKVIFKPSTTEIGTKEAEVEVTLADGTKVIVKVPVEVVDSLGTADKDNDLAKAKEDAKKQVEDAAKKKLDEIKKDTGLTEEQKQKAEEAINKVKEDANKAIDGASSAGTAKQIADQAKENIEKYNPKADAEVKKPDVTNLDEEKAKAKAEILEEAQKRIDEIKNNKDLSDEAKAKAIEEINKAKDKAIEDINKAQSKDEINAAKEAGIHKINEVQPDGSIASKFEPKVPENKVEVENPAKLSDEEREQVRQNIEGANTFPDGTTVEVKPDGTAVITYKDGSSDTISKDKLVAPANKETGTIASRTEPVIPGKTQVGNTTKLTPEEQAAVKKAVEEANNFPAGTTVEVRPDGTVVITYPDKSVDTIPGDKLVEKRSKQETPKVQTDAEKNPAQVPGNFVPVENTHNLTQTEQDTVAAKVKEANPAATDVKVSKDGTATLTYGDGSVNTIPGTSLVVAKDTDNEATTQAAQNPAVVPATTEVGNAHSLTPEEQAAVTAKVQAANPAATDVKVSKDGTATLTYSDGSVNTIPGTSLVVQKEEVPTQEQSTIAEKTKVIIPANPIKVAEATRLTDEEKEAVKKAVVDANGFGSDVKVEVAGDGTATIVFKDGSAITIPGNQLVAQDPKAQDSTKPTAEKSTVKAPAQRVDVKDITHLTDEEKEKVKVAILQANGSALDGATINVAGDGTATITFPDGSVVTILGKDTVQQSAKGESVTQEATPEYKPETTPGGDNGGNTGSSDANANAGGGSQAGGQAHTGQNSSQSQASKQLATEKESARNAIEKAAKDKQDEIKGAPLSDKEKAELLARVEAEKQAALKEIENAKTVEDVKEAETIGVQAIAMVTVPKRPVASNAAPQATSAPQATAGTMQDVTYQSPAGKQLPNTGSASSAALASLGLVAATSGFALLGRKARRRK
ncbi:putative surface anchored protein (pseudogene) [Streptococcus pneumoniae]|nr:putative surface anchored protein (pseudogene) [Streptococcus pneumoniae]